MSDDRKWSISILKKMGIEVPAKISTARVKKRLERHLIKKGVPEGLTGNELDLVGSLGLMPKGHNTEPLPPSSKKKGKKKAKPEKTPKASKGKEKKTVGEKAKGVVETFKKAFAKKAKRLRSDVIEEVVVKCTVPPATVSNYISWAKQTWKKENPFGFHLKEEKDKDGNKVLSKI